MRAIHLLAPESTTGLLPLCGSWDSMDTGWTTAESAVTCAACASDLRSLASGAAVVPKTALRTDQLR